MNCSTYVPQLRSTFLLDILPKVNLKNVSDQRKRIFKMQDVDKKNKKKKEAECCNNCVYSPLTILGNKELNEREKK